MLLRFGCVANLFAGPQTQTVCPMTTHQALDGRLHPNIDSGLFLINHLRSTNHTDVQISKARHLVVHSGLVAELTFVRTEKKT